MTRFQDINYPLEQLPAMPAIAAEVFDLVNTGIAAAKLASVVSCDAAMSAQVLKIANSSFYAMSRRVTTLSSAIVLIGEKTLRNLVLAVSLKGMNRAFGPLETMLWKDSIICAFGTRFLAQQLNLADPEEAFMAGLFRHIGKIVMNNQSHQFPERQQFLRAAVAVESIDIAKREREYWGATHDEIGAAVLEQWKLSDDLAFVALHHFDLEFGQSCDKATADMVCLVNIANYFPALLGTFGSVSERHGEPICGALALGLDWQDTEALIDEFCDLMRHDNDLF